MAMITSEKYTSTVLLELYFSLLET